MLSIDVRMLYSSGIGTYIRNVVPMILAELKQYPVTLIGNTADISSCFSYAKNVNIVQCSAPIYSVSEQVQILKAIPRGTRLLWIPHYNIPVFYAGRLLVTVHDVFHLAMGKQVGGFDKQIYARSMFNVLKYKASQVICPSNFTQGELSSYTNMRPEKIRVIHNGVDEKTFFIEKREAINCSHKPYILYVGNVKPHKNIAVLLRAFAVIMKEIDYNVVIVGKKEGFLTGDEHISSQAKELGDRVIFTGEISDEHLRYYYNCARVLVFPSLYEGFGLPPLEAMACGCPVIASSIPTSTEICGDAALYFEPRNHLELAERILTVVRNNDIYGILQKKGLNRVKMFSWNSCGLSTAVLIREILDYESGDRS